MTRKRPRLPGGARVHIVLVLVCFVWLVPTIGLFVSAGMYLDVFAAAPELPRMPQLGG